MSATTPNVIISVFSPNRWAAAGKQRWLAFLNLGLLLAIIGLFVGYLWLNNQTAAYGFAIRGYERQITQLEDEKRQLDLEVLTRRSMDNVESRVKDLGFVPVQQVDYLMTGSSGVALR